MTLRFTVQIRRSALKQLAGVPGGFRIRIEKAIDRLAQTPYPHGCRKLAGEDNLWRIRVGDYRVIYLVENTIRIVEIHAIGHRQSIYKN
ncbi:MAG: type II toxin-antitoxin system RelE/ParE family toxin [Alphaproteobacteria bacterium]|nr:type II toxin-antitoxin system RelE/ParE family toxin [Alphaproteobacteria bacterium]